MHVKNVIKVKIFNEFTMMTRCGLKEFRIKTKINVKKNKSLKIQHDFSIFNKKQFDNFMFGSTAFYGTLTFISTSLSYFKSKISEY